MAKNARSTNRHSNSLKARDLQVVRAAQEAVCIAEHGRDPGARKHGEGAAKACVSDPCESSS